MKSLFNSLLVLAFVLLFSFSPMLLGSAPFKFYGSLSVNDEVCHFISGATCPPDSASIPAGSTTNIIMNFLVYPDCGHPNIYIYYHYTMYNANQTESSEDEGEIEATAGALPNTWTGNFNITPPSGWSGGWVLITYWSGCSVCSATSGNKYAVLYFS